MVRRESGFGSRCCGLRHGELRVVRLQFRCRGGARGAQLYGQRAAMITFRSFSANVKACPKPKHLFLQCMSPLLAHSGHRLLHRTCPLLGVNRTSFGLKEMSAYDAVDGQLCPGSRRSRAMLHSVSIFFIVPSTFRTRKYSPKSRIYSPLGHINHMLTCRYNSDCPYV